MNWHDHIATDPGVLAGKPVVKGTRLSVEFLLGLFAAGWTERQVLENYPHLTPEGLQAAFAYAQERISDDTWLAPKAA
ncbi:MAG: DUF433 domain-containing protein [Nevskia sp.]|nr:DUF433 domain-containing protein [Nevskia sp.]